MKKRVLLNLALALSLVAAASAQAGFLDSLSDAVSVAEKAVSITDSAVKVGTAAQKASQDITPEQEYYIGRAVGANILGKYRPVNDKRLNTYVNYVGLAVAGASDRPDTFGGYHFLVFDSPEINAFACPGGLILVSRGLVGLCQNEDDLAAVLAHEVGHVQYQHGLGAIGQSRIIDLLRVTGAEGFKQFGSGQVAQMETIFAGSIGDVVETLAVTGYSKGQEKEADLAAVAILGRVGYDPQGLARVLQAMKNVRGASEEGFFKTHPDPDERLESIAEALAQAPPVSVPPARVQRFQTVTAAIR